MNDMPLPNPIRRYQDAHDRRDIDAALAMFSADAHVNDDGQNYDGINEIRDWLANASAANRCRLVVSLRRSSRSPKH